VWLEGAPVKQDSLLSTVRCGFGCRTRSLTASCRHCYEVKPSLSQLARAVLAHRASCRCLSTTRFVPLPMATQG